MQKSLPPIPSVHLASIIRPRNGGPAQTLTITLQSPVLLSVAFRGGGSGPRGAKICRTLAQQETPLSANCYVKKLIELCVDQRGAQSRNGERQARLSRSMQRERPRGWVKPVSFIMDSIGDWEARINRQSESEAAATAGGKCESPKRLRLHGALRRDKRSFDAAAAIPQREMREETAGKRTRPALLRTGLLLRRKAAQHTRYAALVRAAAGQASNNSTETVSDAEKERRHCRNRSAIQYAASLFSNAKLSQTFNQLFASSPDAASKLC